MNGTEFLEKSTKYRNAPTLHNEILHFTTLTYKNALNGTYYFKEKEVSFNNERKFLIEVSFAYQEK